MNTERLSETLAQSLAGVIAFPEVVRVLTSEGVESYHADLIRREETFYAPAGETYVAPMLFPDGPIAEAFSAEGVQAAIRGSQAGAMLYREFLDQLRSAGTVAYIVSLTGRRCLYWGRQLEFHLEYFPGTRS